MGAETDTQKSNLRAINALLACAATAQALDLP